MSSPKFPLELLEKSAAEREEYFENYTILHAKLQKAFNRVNESIYGSKRESIILIYGPSGVGKTAFSNRIVNTIIKQDIKSGICDDTTIPALRIKASAPKKGNFDWDKFYECILTEMKDPSILYTHECSTLEKKMLNALYHRKTRAVIVDEAQHIWKITGGRKQKDQLDLLKDLSNDKHFVFVLFGTYELITPIVELGDQLNRRSILIHFPRYQDAKEDITTFRQVLNDFQNHLPVEEMPDLNNNWKFIYKRTIGCVGTLKILLNLSLHKALNSNTALTMDIVESCALLPAQVETMYAEARQGELLAAKYEEDANKLDHILANHDKNKKQKGQSDQNTAYTENKKENKRGRNRIERNPRRDPTGDVKNA